jgi:hypothetical protein
MAPGFVTLAQHDQRRDRLVLIDATSDDLALAMLESVAWADGAVAGAGEEDRED